jgi:putative addiction module component (TIGR02574 family)
VSTKVIENEALGLSPQEKARLIDVLWGSLADAELKSREEAWAEESERRIDAYEDGKLKARDANEIFSDLKRKVRE